MLKKAVKVSFSAYSYCVSLFIVVTELVEETGLQFEAVNESCKKLRESECAELEGFAFGPAEAVEADFEKLSSKVHGRSWLHNDIIKEANTYRFWPVRACFQVIPYF